jgi:hypothetical protein
MCDQIPRFHNKQQQQAETCSDIDLTNSTLTSNNNSKNLLLAAKVYIHARDKPNMLQWIDLLTKIFNSSKEVCKCLINYLCTSDSNSGGGAHLC